MTAQACNAAEALAAARRLVVKIGSTLLVAKNGELRRTRPNLLAEDVACCREPRQV